MSNLSMLAGKSPLIIKAMILRRLNTGHCSYRRQTTYHVEHDTGITYVHLN